MAIATSKGFRRLASMTVGLSLMCLLLLRQRFEYFPTEVALMRSLGRFLKQKHIQEISTCQKVAYEIARYIPCTLYIKGQQKRALDHCVSAWMCMCFLNRITVWNIIYAESYTVTDDRIFFPLWLVFPALEAAQSIHYFWHLEWNLLPDPGVSCKMIGSCVYRLVGLLSVLSTRVLSLRALWCLAYQNWSLWLATILYASSSICELY